MSKVQKIEVAIHALSQSERADLIKVLPRILPELDGEAEWERIIKDPQPNPAFSKYIDNLEAELNSGKVELNETSDEEFRRRE